MNRGRFPGGRAGWRWAEVCRPTRCPQFRRHGAEGCGRACRSSPRRAAAGRGAERLWDDLALRMQLLGACLGYDLEREAAELLWIEGRTILDVVSACPLPFSLSTAKSVLPCILPSAFHVLSPWRTRTIRLGEAISGSSNGSSFSLSFRAEKSSEPVHS